MTRQRTRSVAARATMLQFVAVITLLTAACGSSSSTVSSSTPSPTGSSSSAPAPEPNPAGDIPDSQAYIAFRGLGFTIRVPEGWARSAVVGGALFVDKYNSVRAVRDATPTQPTVQQVQSHDLPTVSRLPGYRAGRVTTVTRKAGNVVLLTYEVSSAPNPVTGKVIRLAVERYTFWRAQARVTLTLSSPVGADNVDPWRTVTDSLTWA